MRSLERLMADLSRQQYRVSLEDGQLLVRGPKAPSATLLRELKARRGEILAHVLVEPMAGAPEEWFDGVVQALNAKSARGFSKAHWDSLRVGLQTFAMKWSTRAAALGWTTIEVFGCHPDKPFERTDMHGLAMTLVTADVVAITAETVGLRIEAHGEPVIYRKPSPEAMERAVPIWLLTI